MEIVYFVTISLLVVGILVAIVLLLRQYRHSQNLQNRVAAAEQQTLPPAISELPLGTLQTLSKEFTKARQGSEIIGVLLDGAMKISGAAGISYVSLDDHGNVLPAIRRGNFPFPVPDAWLEYLASPIVRNSCQRCTMLESHAGPCVLLQGPFSEHFGLYCFPLRLAEREIGMLNIYMPPTKPFEDQTRALLQILVNICALALESDLLRRRTDQTLAVNLKSDRYIQELSAVMTALLENLRKVIHARACLMVLGTSPFTSLKDQIEQGRALVSGEVPPGIQEILEKDYATQLTHETPKVHVCTENPAASDAWLSVPIRIPGEAVMGLLIVAGKAVAGFSKSQIQLVQSAADQMAIINRYAKQVASMEYRVMMDERTRLSREIHDGLAQTLGFLKLKVAQSFNYLERNDLTRLQQTLKLIYEALANAYQDARQAIDGLRVSLDETKTSELENWLRQTLVDYSEYAFSIELDIDESSIHLPEEVHAQLIRIVQEALSNVRKHAYASKVKISFTKNPQDLILEIQDNGVGFTPEDVPNPSRFGLRGMRERAELIGADFQVISQPGKGTIIRVRIPVEEKDRLEV